MQKVTLAFLRRRVRRLADEQSSSGGASSFVSKDDLDEAINEAVPAYYALLTEVQKVSCPLVPLCTCQVPPLKPLLVCAVQVFPLAL